jgi:hypothetical protein
LGAVIVLAGTVIGGLSLLLGLAAYAKARRPQPTTEALRAAGAPAPAALVRLLTAAELAVAVAGLSLPGRIGGAVVAGSFAALAAGAVIAGRVPQARACGCFGDWDGLPLGRRHVTTNAAAAAAAAGAALTAPGSLVDLVSRRPFAGLAGLLLAVMLALAVRESLRGRSASVLSPSRGRSASALSPSRGRSASAPSPLRRRSAGGPSRLEASALRLVDASAHALEGRFSRRSALARVAVAGSAMTVAPLRYLLYPGTALGVVVPGSCGNGLCTDGYTAFCCEINQGVNGCPTGTFIGGWWMCTDYRGHQLCAGTGVRYYIDCNALPGHPFPGGCRCADGSCDKRRIACNVFRYGQCNTQVRGTTAVVCRVITCENPGRNPEFNCSTAVMVDDAVCGHEAGCLEPVAVQLPGAGGA